MNSATDVRLIINAVDNASRTIAGVNKELTGMGKASQVAGDFAAGLGMNLGTMVNPAMAAGQAVAMIGSAIKQSVDAYTTYAAQVRDLSVAYGISAEEASAMLQVADDLAISENTLRVAMRSMAREGIAPSIDGLKSLITKYQSIKSPVERAQFAMEVFGSRAGPDMVKLLEATPEAIDDIAESAKEAGLIMSGESLAAAEEYRLAVDNLSDTWEGLKITAGTSLVPALTDVLDITNVWIAAEKKANEETSGFGQTVGRVIPPLGAFERAGRTIVNMFDELTGEEEENTEEVEANTEAVDAAAIAIRDKERRLRQLAVNTLPMASGNTLDFAAATAEATKSQDYMKAALERTNNAMDILASNIEGPVGAELDNFKEKQEELRDRQQEVNDKIRELNELPYLTEEQQAELDELQTEQGEIEQEFRDIAAAHDDQTARILYNLAQQQLAMSNLDASQQLQILRDMATELGIVDTETEELNLAIQALTSATNQENLGNYGAAMDYLAGAIEDGHISAEELNRALDILNGKTVTATVNINVNGTVPDLGVDNTPAPIPAENEQEYDGRLASGGPAVAGQSYLVGETGPELLRMGGSGQVINNWNLTINSSGVEDPVRRFGMMQAFARG